MSKGGNWVPLDKSLVKTLGTLNRPYSEVEAMFSHTVNVDCGRPWTYRGYAKVWQWSVGKVKRFVEGMMNTSGTVVGRKGNGSGTEVHYIDKGLWVLDERKRNGSGTVDEHKRVAISNPNPNPNKKDFLSDSNEVRLSQLLFSKILLRNPEHKKPNIQNWAKDIDKMIRLDNRDPQKIANLITWVQNDSFEQNNVLCTGKLRKRFDALFLKMTAPPKLNASEDRQLQKELALTGGAK